MKTAEEKQEYEPFGLQWEKEVMKLPKKHIIDLYRKQCLERKRLEKPATASLDEFINKFKSWWGSQYSDVTGAKTIEFLRIELSALLAEKDEELQELKEMKEANENILKAKIRYRCLEDCMLDYTNFEAGEEIIIADHCEDRDWKGTDWFDQFPQIFELIIEPNDEPSVASKDAQSDADG